jgi:integrase
MSVHQRKDSGSWVAKYRDEFGKQITITFGKGEEARKKAEAYDHDIKAQKLRNEQLQTGLTEDVGIYADELADLWYQDRKAAGCGAWLKDWANILNKHILPHISNIPVEELKQASLVKFINRRYKKNSPTTRNRYLSYLKIMFNWGVKHEYLSKNPLAKWQKAKELPKELTLTAEDLQKIHDTAAPHIKWAIEIAMNLGVRTGLSELLVLQWKHVDWENKCVRVFATKTKTWRSIPIRPEFLDKLREKRAKGKTCFLVEYNGRSIKSFSKGFRNACRRAKISDDIISYDIRHLFCSSMLSQRASPNAVSRLMGHASTKMTLDRYGHVMPGDEDRAIELLPVIE